MRWRDLATVLALGSALVAALAPRADAAGEIGTVKLVKVSAYGTPVGQRQREIFVRGDVTQNELVETVANGALHLEFRDATEIRLGSQSRLVLDRFAYDPNRKSGELVASFSRGAMRFVTGRMDKAGFRVLTPVALIGVRGTDFTVRVDADGSTAVSVAEGQVEITPLAGGAPQVITVGQVATVAAAGAGSQAGVQVGRGRSVSNDVGLTADAGGGGSEGGGGGGGGGGDCFTAKTLVLLADGRTKSIRDVVVGEEVLAFDFGRGEKVAARVATVRSAMALSHLKINGLEVTTGHPFAVGADTWKAAGTLIVGDLVWGAETIERIDVIAEPTAVFTLTVGERHNFFVTDGHRVYLVHNKG
jgi:hypothetical protein